MASPSPLLQICCGGTQSNDVVLHTSGGAGPTSVFGEKESTINRKICELHSHVCVKYDPCSHCEPGPAQNLNLMQLSPCLNLSFFSQILSSSLFVCRFLLWKFNMLEIPNKQHQFNPCQRISSLKCHFPHVEQFFFLFSFYLYQ